MARKCLCILFFKVCFETLVIQTQSSLQHRPVQPLQNDKAGTPHQTACLPPTAPPTQGAKTQLSEPLLIVSEVTVRTSLLLVYWHSHRSLKLGLCYEKPSRAHSLQTPVGFTCTTAAAECRPGPCTPQTHRGALRGIGAKGGTHFTYFSSPKINKNM